MTFRERSRKPNMGKSDPIDARAIARIVAREPDLPGAHCAEGGSLALTRQPTSQRGRNDPLGPLLAC